MRKVVVSEFLTLSGVMEDPSWSMAYWHDEIAKVKYDEMFASDALLLGRLTYSGFAVAWPKATNTGDFGERMNSMPKYVVSSTPTELTWNNSRLLKGNVAEEVSRLKQEPGQDILVAGSAQLVQALRQHNLVDDYLLLVYPVVLGSGKRIFQGGDRTNLKLVQARSFPSGVVLLHYQPADW